MLTHLLICVMVYTDNTKGVFTIFSAEEILKMTEPGELFPNNNVETIKKEYRDLVKSWHPDTNGNSKESNDVMVKINVFYNECLKMVKTNSYKKPGFISISGKDGKTYEVTYRISHSFELGTMYVGNNVVLYLVDEVHRDLVQNANKVVSGFKYADNGMKEEISKYLPTIVSTFETQDNKLGIVVKKTPDLFLLKDILYYHNGNMPVRHVSWIISSLYNLACYLDYSKLSHNAISLDTYFVSPVHHSGALLGGWWYSVPQESKMIGVTANIYSIMPPYVRNKKCGSILTDLESIRLIGRELLGDRNGTKLATTSDIPQPIIDWFRGVSSENAFKDYSKWKEVIYKSFGEKKFIEMKINDNDLYAKVKN